MRRYNPTEIEPKWQKIWHEDNRYKAKDFSQKTKFYVTGMFPYPSGAGMHAGHFLEHSIVDAVARFRRALGYEVMYPIGWDSFGLPAENYAIKTGKSPSVTTKENIANYTNQLKRVGASIDWEREISTSDPDYYKWTQWIFTEFFKRGLAYQKESLQWWCPVDKTVLANEQVEAGKCWRCAAEVEKKSLKQWFFKITDYADALLEEIPALDWPDKIKSAQINWIGKSLGAEIEFKVKDQSEAIKVFTTRPDTIFGASFVVLAPEHPLAQALSQGAHKKVVQDYIKQALKKSEIDRTNDSKEKTGVFTGSFAINPASGQKVPIWVADYVLGAYGTGAVMAVPAHDERDFMFAQKYDLPIVQVVEKPEDSTDSGAYTGEGELVNSGIFDGQRSEEAREEIVAWLEQQKLGKLKTTYKMHDWLISRQRYWGAPIPIIHCPQHGAVAVPESDLPVLLPEINDYKPKGGGKSVLADVKDWVNTTCPTCGIAAKRETDTLDGFACSSWYLLRYMDPKNNQQAWSPKKADFWSPVDMYVGGDHATAHLLYVRFWSHVFYEMGLVPGKEPVKKLVYHGLVQAEDGRKMSKSLGNVIDPLEVIDAGYGADALRMFELFLGPINENSNWSSRGIAGVYRFLNRVWTLTQEYIEANPKAISQSKNPALISLTHQTIKKVTEDYQRLSFNTAIAALMEFVNNLYKLKQEGFDQDWRFALESLLKLVAPIAPHLAAELWQQLGHEEALDFVAWPTWNEADILLDEIKIIVQVNGKVRATLSVDAAASEAQIKELALSDEKVQKHLAGKKPTKIIYVPGRLINLVA